MIEPITKEKVLVNELEEGYLQLWAMLEFYPESISCLNCSRKKMGEKKTQRLNQNFCMLFIVMVHEV